MSVFYSLGVKDLRCLCDTGFIDISPITILVGKNSAGKSTFARIFPLLRQSAEEEKRSPILWFGRRVDFGNFETAINRRSTSNKIEFSFRLSIEPTLDHRRYSNPEIKETIVSVTLCLHGSSNSTYADSVSVDVYGNILRAQFDEGDTTKITVNGTEIEQTKNIIIKKVQSKILPTFRYFRAGKNSKTNNFFWQTRFGHSYNDQLRDIVYSILKDKRTKPETIDGIVSRIHIGDDKSILGSLISASPESSLFRKKVRDLKSTDTNFIVFKNLLFAREFSNLLNQIDDSLAEYFESVSYIEPLRATAQRYYRRQELAIDELDSRGENIAMFIDGLTTRKRKELNDWMYSHFKVRLKPMNTGGHVALELETENDSKGTNLADIGFGFSQLLPIIIQLWQVKQREIRKRFWRTTTSTAIVIEQPELHLHPAYQANLADVFASTICSDNQKSSKTEQTVSIIAETHSPHLINRLGQLVEERILSENDVQIVLFEEASISTTRFNSKGVLENWPFGFFEP